MAFVLRHYYIFYNFPTLRPSGAYSLKMDDILDKTFQKMHKIFLITTPKNLLQNFL